MTAAAAAAAVGVRMAQQRVAYRRTAHRAPERQQLHQTQYWGPDTGVGASIRQAQLDLASMRQAQVRYELLVSIPTRVFSEADRDVVGECAICLGAFAAGEKMKLLPCASQHRFHAACLRKWFERQTCCPICRVDASTAPPRSEGDHVV